MDNNKKMIEVVNKTINILNENKLDYKVWKMYYELYQKVSTRLDLNRRIRFIIALNMCTVLINNTNESIEYATINDRLRIEYHGTSKLIDTYENMNKSNNYNYKKSK